MFGEENTRSFYNLNVGKDFLDNYKSNMEKNQQNSLFEKINKTDEPLARLVKKKKKKQNNSSNRDEILMIESRC